MFESFCFHTEPKKTHVNPVKQRWQTFIQAESLETTDHSTEYRHKTKQHDHIKQVERHKRSHLTTDEASLWPRLCLIALVMSLNRDG